MLAAFAEAARTLNREDYRIVAERNAEFLLRELRQNNGRLLRTWKAGEARLNGYLEDYAYLIEGLLELYQTAFESKWFVAAQELAEAMIEHYADSDGTFFDTSDDHETLITRPRDLQDNATPSGNAMAVTTLLKLAGFTNDVRTIDIAHQALAQMQTPTGGGMMSLYPLEFGKWLQALAYSLSQPREIAIIGDPQAADTQALLNVVRESYRPLQVVALGSPDGLQLARAPTAKQYGRRRRQYCHCPALQDRGVAAAQATAYVCDASAPGRAFACQSPVVEPEMLRTRLDSR